jgi:hypothetical protein
MMPPKAATLLGQIHRDLTEIQILRQEIRRAPDQITRDKAIIRHSHTLGQITEALQSLEDAGILQGFPMAT